MTCRNVHAAEHLQDKACRGDDDVGLQFAAVLQANAAFGEAIDLAGGHRCLLLPDRAEEVTVRH